MREKATGQVTKKTASSLYAFIYMSFTWYHFIGLQSCTKYFNVYIRKCVVSFLVHSFIFRMRTHMQYALTHTHRSAQITGTKKRRNKPFCQNTEELKQTTTPPSSSPPPLIHTHPHTTISLRRSNGQKMPKPIKLFEITDVVLKDDASDVGAINRSI